ncbi:MAG: PcfJ domain-containing protein [Treponema sp.]|nr:PcfJ domain-containing protein [Treponema sp.]
MNAMHEQFVWYRAASPAHPEGIWTALAANLAEERAVLRHVQTGKILCPSHCRWENYTESTATSTQAATDSGTNAASSAGLSHITCECGYSLHALLVPWVPVRNAQPLPQNRGVLVLSGGSKPFKRAYASLCAGIRKQEADADDEVCDKDDTEDKNKLPFDGEGIPYDIFMYSLELDYAESSCFVGSRNIDRKRFLSIPEGNFMHVRLPETSSVSSFFLRGKKKREHGKTVTQYNVSVGFSYYSSIDSIPQVPAFLNAKIEEAAPRLVASFAGRDIRVNTSVYHGLKLLTALSFFPYEANICYVANKAYLLNPQKNGESLLSDRTNPAIYNRLCEKFGIKSFPHLRRLFDKEPDSLIWYKNLYNLGFRDPNIMMDIVNLCAKTVHTKAWRDYKTCSRYWWGRNEKREKLAANLPTTFLNHIDTWHGDDYDNPFIFFCGYSIPRRGERATWKALNREPALDEYDRSDIAHNFRRYFTDLKPEEREMVLHEGFTRRVHDTLAKIAMNIQHQNHVFTYTEAQKALVDEVDGYSFQLPQDSATMHVLGSAMHNCVFSYWERVRGGSCTIVYATKDDRYEACIEVADLQRILQARGNYNRGLTGDVAKAFSKWRVKHHLV